jgi:hypothetical protein
MMNAKDAKATALAVITFLIRPSIFLIVGLAVGYGIGFVDAFRQSDTIGDKVARAVLQMHPAYISEGVSNRATAIHTLKAKKTGLNDDPTAAAPDTAVPPPDATIPPGY